MLTTVDNPYNPYTDNDKWYNWDRAHMHYTYETLARITGPVDPTLTEIELQALYEIAEDRLVNGGSGLFAFITPDDKAPLDANAYDEECTRFEASNRVGDV